MTLGNVEPKHVLSPELALVDPAAAEEARRALPEIVLYEDTPRQAAVPPRYEEVRRLFSEDELAEEPRRPSLLRRLLVLVIVVLLVLVVAALAAVLLGAWTPLESRSSSVATEPAPTLPAPTTSVAPPPTSPPATTAPPATASTHAAPTTTTAPATTAPETTTAPATTTAPETTTAPATTTVALTSTAPATTAATPPPPSPPAGRRLPPFAWVEMPGAGSYRVEFSRGGRIVYATSTKRPRLTVPARRLPPANYRWRVWAIGPDGHRLETPLVDARVTIP